VDEALIGISVEVVASAVEAAVVCGDAGALQAVRTMTGRRTRKAKTSNE